MSDETTRFNKQNRHINWVSAWAYECNCLVVKLKMSCLKILKRIRGSRDPRELRGNCFVSSDKVAIPQKPKNSKEETKQGNTASSDWLNKLNFGALSKQHESYFSCAVFRLCKAFSSFALAFLSR